VEDGGPVISTVDWNRRLSFLHRPTEGLGIDVEEILGVSAVDATVEAKDGWALASNVMFRSMWTRSAGMLTRPISRP